VFLLERLLDGAKFEVLHTRPQGQLGRGHHLRVQAADLADHL
jgi:hypothetical protein